jgi:chromosome segregation ATPase
MAGIDDQQTIGVVADLFAAVAALAKGGEPLDNKIKELQDAAQAATQAVEVVNRGAAGNAKDTQALVKRQREIDEAYEAMHQVREELTAREEDLQGAEAAFKAQRQADELERSNRHATAESQLAQQQSLLNARAESLNEQKRDLDAGKKDLETALADLDKRAAGLDKQAEELTARLAAFKELATTATA